MRKLLSLILLAIVANAQANPISEQTARQHVLSFLSSTQGRNTNLRMKAPKAPVQVTTVEELSREGAFYVMNIGNDGFVIASADDAVQPVLGYSDKGNVSADDIPEAMQELLDSYAKQMAHINARRAPSASVIPHSPIDPLVKSVWSQGTRTGSQPYNLLCPVYNDSYCYAGCVSVAMAQVMNYHRWPARSTNPIPSYQTNALIGTLSALPPVNFDWNNILDTYTGNETQAQMNAVAQLFKYCAWSVRTNFGTTSSSSIVSNICSAMVDYFDYSPGMQIIMRSAYTSAQWDDIIYNELLAGRPVIYSGHSATNGLHAFVCDGCDNSGYYHVNWGWNGKHDGYFLLSLMDAFKDGTSPGHNPEDGFSMEQQMVIGIQPSSAGIASDYALTTKNVYIEDNSLRFMIFNYTGHAFAVDYGWGFYDGNNNLVSQGFRHTDNYVTNFGFITTIDYATLGQALGSDGTYRVVAISRLDGSSEWKANNGSDFYYADVTVSNGKVTKVVCHPKDELTLQDVVINGSGYSYATQEIEAIFYNGGTDEFYGSVYMFVNDESTPTGATGISAPVNSTGSGYFYFTPVEGGNYTLTFKDADGNVLGTKSVYIYQGVPQVSVTASIEGLFEENGINYLNSTTASVTVNVTNTTSEAISQQVLVGISDFKGWTFNIPVGRTASGIMKISVLQVGKRYTVRIIDNAHNDLCPSITFTIRSGSATAIDEIDANRSSSSTVWNLKGQAVARPSKGIYIKDGKKFVVK